MKSPRTSLAIFSITDDAEIFPVPVLISLFLLHPVEALHREELAFHSLRWQQVGFRRDFRAESNSRGAGSLCEKGDLKGRLTWQRGSRTRWLTTHCDKRTDTEMIKATSQRLCERVRITKAGQGRSRDWQTGGVRNCPWSLGSPVLSQGTWYPQGPLF